MVWIQIRTDILSVLTWSQTVCKDYWLTFFKINFFIKFFQEHYQSVTCLDPDEDQHTVGPDLGPNSLQRLL